MYDTLFIFLTIFVYQLCKIHFFACAGKLHSCTTQKHQIFDHKWQGLHSQMAFYQCCLTTKMHFVALRGINRTAWSTKLLLIAVLAHPGIVLVHVAYCEGTVLLFKLEWLL